MGSKQRSHPEAEQRTHELENLLTQFTDEEIETGVTARGTTATPNECHTLTTLRHLLCKALLEQSLARLLRSARDTAGLSLADTATRSGLTPDRVQEHEREGTDLELHTLRRYANALGYDLQVGFIPRGGDAPALHATASQPPPPPDSTSQD